MGQYLDRYLRGEWEQVWDDLVGLGDQVRQEPVYSDAWAVACETMRRVHQNIKVLIPCLRSFGYVFIHDPLPHGISFSRGGRQWIQGNPPLYTEPARDIVSQLDTLERDIGLLPLSLRAFYQEVGGVNFVGWYEGEEVFDPFFVYPFDRELIDAYSDDFIFEPLEEGQPATREFYRLIISPDGYHKMNASGGAPYQIRLPNAVADAPLLYEEHQTTFVGYLRQCCSGAGFPERDFVPSPLAEHLQEMQRGIVSF